MIKSGNLRFKKGHIVLIGFLIILSTLNVSAGKANPAGWVSIFALLLLTIFFSMVYINKNKAFPSLLSRTINILFLFNLMYLIGILNGGLRIRGVVVYLQLTVLMVFVILMALMDWEHREIRIISKFIEIFIVMNFIVLVVMGFPRPFKSFTGNSNVFSALVFFFSFFPVLNYLLTKKFQKKVYLFFIIAINLLLILMGQSRAIWAAALLSLIVFWKWGFITKSKVRYYLLFLGIVIANVGFVILLPLLRQHPNSSIWNQFVFEKTGGNLFSGREWIWAQLLTAIMDKPIMGYGAGTTPSDLTSIRLSSHNLYVQTAIQVGLIGTGILFLLLLSIWVLMYKGRNNIYTKLSGAYFIGIMVYQSAEVSLTQNNMAVGIIMWLIIAIGVSHSIKGERNNRINK